MGEGPAVGSLNTLLLSLPYATVVSTVLYYSTTVCSSVYACALLLYATALLYSLYYSSALVFYRLPPALYDCVTLAFLILFLAHACGFLILIPTHSLLSSISSLAVKVMPTTS